MQATTITLDGFELEYRLAPHMVVFSHGFGVRRDARGMFTDIAESLPNGFGFVLFEYNMPEGDKLRLTSLSDQVARLKQVIAWARQQPGVESISIVAHSKGCTVTALAQPDNVGSVIMLTPPLHVGSGTMTMFTTRPGAVRDGDTWSIPRSDGTTSLVDQAVFDEMATVNGENVVIDYAEKRPLHVVAAGDDRILPNQDYSRVAACPGVTLDVIPVASHDFAGAARQPLVHLVTQYLTESQ